MGFSSISGLVVFGIQGLRGYGSREESVRTVHNKRINITNATLKTAESFTTRLSANNTA